MSKVVVWWFLLGMMEVCLFGACRCELGEDVYLRVS